MKASKGERNEKAVRLSQDIRNDLKIIKLNAVELDSLQKKQAQKLEEQKAKGKTKNVTPEIEEEIKKKSGNCWFNIQTYWRG